MTNTTEISPATVRHTRSELEHPPIDVPDHQLLRPIGLGAYGEVWLARNVVGTYRAVKVVYRKSFKNERPFEREYRGMQKFEPISRSNDGLVDILQIGRNESEGCFYYVMELADDATSTECLNVETYVPKTLQQVIRERGRLTFDECLQFALSLSLALGHLHRHGLIHRDLKPSNIIFVAGVPKLADIGLVTELEEARSFVGTEGFIPPEGPNSPQADIYSLGKVLYESSMGKDRMDFPEPFTALGQATGSHDLEELNVVIMKACATDPRERYQTAEEMHLDLALLQSGKSVKSRRTLEKRLAVARRVASIVAVLALLTLGAYFVQRQQTRTAKQAQRSAEEATDRLQIQNAEALFQRGDSALALAHLAEISRRNPRNRVAVERMLAALQQRNFPQLAFPPLKHPNKVAFARFSSNGECILTTCDDFNLRLFRSDAGTAIGAPLAHPDEINWAEFSPDSTRVATAASRTVWIWQVTNAAPALPALVHPNRVDVATFSPDGHWLATGCADGNLRLFSLETGELLYSLKSYEANDKPTVSQVTVASFSPDGGVIASAATDGTILVRQRQSGDVKYRLSMPGGPRFLVISPDGHRLAVAATSKGWEVHVFDLRSGQSTPTILRERGRIYSIQFSPDSERLLTASGEYVANVWDLKTRSILFSLPHRGFVHSAAFSPDGKRIVTASADHTAKVWNALSGGPISENMLHQGRVMHAEFSADGERILTASRDYTARVWKINQGNDFIARQIHPSPLRLAEFDSTGELVLTATSGFLATAGDALRRNPGQQQFVTTWQIETDSTNSLAITPKGAEILAAQFTDAGPKSFVIEEGRSRHGRIVDLRTGEMAGGAILHPEEIMAARFSDDGKKLATGSRDGSVRLWDGARGLALAPSYEHMAPVNSIRFSADGRLLVVAGENGTAVMLDGVTGARLDPALTHNAGIWFAQFSARGDLIVTTSRDYKAKIWSTNGTLVATLPHTAEVEYAEFSPDGSKVVTASSDGSARIWATKTGLLLQALEHSDAVLMARFSPDGLRIVTASMDRTGQLWDVQTALKLADPFRHFDAVTAASFSPNGKMILTISADQRAKLWKVPNAGSEAASLPELAEKTGGYRLNANRIPEPLL